MVQTVPPAAVNPHPELIVEVGMRAGVAWMVFALASCTGGKPAEVPTTVEDDEEEEEEEETDGWTTSSTWTTVTTGPTSTSVPGGPQILSLSTNVNRITESESFRISAIVTDPDGIDDLIGGELVNEQGASLGTFSTNAQEGAYEMIVSWADIDDSDPIELYADLDRPLLARFYDVAGHTAQRIVTITLYCQEGAACDGHCTDVTEDVDNCGVCGDVCNDVPSLYGPACSSGACVAETSCVPAGPQDCDDICAFSGLGACVELPYYNYVISGAAFQVNACAEEGFIVPSCATPVDFLDAYYEYQTRSAVCFCES
jgi:hypothetical protein